MRSCLSFTAFIPCYNELFSFSGVSIVSESKKSIDLNANKLPKWCRLLLLSLPVIMSFCHIRFLDNDFFFLYSTGDYIVHRGFPFTDILSMHSSMKIVVHQWLSSVIFYYVYNVLGEIGILLLLYICNIGIIYLTYKLISIICKNDFISLVLAGLINFSIFDPFIVTRPQLFTYLILLGEVILLEKHAQTKDIKYLFGIPALSLALVNLHAAMWPMILVFMLPFIAAAIPIKIESFKKEPEGSLKAVATTFALSIIVGLLNPYGMDSMLYLTRSYGHESFSIILEMNATNFDASEGKIMLIYLGAIFLALLLLKKKRFSVRHVLLFAGTLLLGVVQVKGVPYFLLFGVPAITYLLEGFDFSGLTKPFKKAVTKRIKILFIILLCGCFFYIGERRLLQTRDVREAVMEHREHLNEVIAILDEEQGPIRLYTDFNNGQYFEFYGYYPYIDGRAEVFVMENNRVYDYFYEYFCHFHGGYYYRDFIDKYQFNYLVIDPGIDSYTYTNLLRDDDFELVYSNYDVNLFVRKQPAGQI